MYQSSVNLTNQHATKIVACCHHSIVTMSPDTFFHHHQKTGLATQHYPQAYAYIVSVMMMAIAIIM